MAKTDKANEKIAARNAVHRALPGPKGNEWATAQAVANATGLSPSAVRDRLAELYTDGSAQSMKHGRVVVWRRLVAAPRLKRDDVPTVKAETIIVTAAPTKPAPDKPKRARRQPAAEAAESDPGAPDAVKVPTPPAAANTPNGGSVGAAVEFLEGARPVSAAPAEPARTRRTPKADRKPYAVWGRGELQTAILDHLRGLADGLAVTPTEVANALNSGTGATAYGLDRLVAKGEAKQTSVAPYRYAAA